MLQIKRLSDGKTWDNEASFLIDRGNVSFSKSWMEYRDGMWRVCYWDSVDGNEVIALIPSLYSVTDSDSIPREEVRRVVQDRRDEHNEAAERIKHEALRLGEIAFALEDEAIASALNIPLSAAEGEAKEARV